MARPKNEEGAAKKPAAPKPAAAKAAKPAEAKAAKPAPAKAAKEPEAKKAPAKKLAFPEKYTGTSMAAYLAEARSLSKKDAKEILDCVFGLIEAGVMAGERVPLGTIGKVHVKIKPATKARMGRNPLTGESIKIPAKKASKAPKFTFSKTFKESVQKAKVKAE